MRQFDPQTLEENKLEDSWGSSPCLPANPPATPIDSIILRLARSSTSVLFAFQELKVEGYPDDAIANVPTSSTSVDLQFGTRHR